MLHLKGRSPVWERRWICRALSLPNTLAQNRHLCLKKGSSGPGLVSNKATPGSLPFLCFIRAARGSRGSNVPLPRPEGGGAEFSDGAEVRVASLKVDRPQTELWSAEDRDTAAACPLTAEGIVPDSGRTGGGAAPGGGKGFWARDRGLEDGFSATWVGCRFMTATWLQICSMSCSWWTCCCCRASRCSRITGIAVVAAFPPAPPAAPPPTPWENWATATLVPRRISSVTLVLGALRPPDSAATGGRGPEVAAAHSSRSTSMASSRSSPSSTSSTPTRSIGSVSKPDESTDESLNAALGTGEGPTGDSSGSGIPPSPFTISTSGSSVQRSWWPLSSVRVKNSAQHLSQTYVSSPPPRRPSASSLSFNSFSRSGPAALLPVNNRSRCPGAAAGRAPVKVL
ncbi:hypothetical protein EYF80_036594 [Liparis tanakae]|uniref:Uncharacterized protein n=1 Tax=Liparis tanakae TaxID=230148 RepID=A0A4Z2GKI0_9TELE|nr:hypothetical protein EYF80_036594 [Liparis tanakae]